jgi:hypothetical protein
LTVIRKVDRSDDAVAHGNRVADAVECERGGSRIGLHRQLGFFEVGGRDRPELTANQLNAAACAIRARDGDGRRIGADPLHIPYRDLGRTRDAQ